MMDQSGKNVTTEKEKKNITFFITIFNTTMKTIFLCILVLCFTFVCCEVSNPFERILGQSCPYKSMQQCETTHICPCRTEDYGSNLFISFKQNNNNINYYFKYI